MQSEAAMTAEGFEEAITRCKRVVYKNRIRVKEFFVDFDKLRCGLVHPNHFVSALSIAGLDRFLDKNSIKALSEGYSVDQSDGLQLVDYKKFCDEVDGVFTIKVALQMWSIIFIFCWVLQTKQLA